MTRQSDKEYRLRIAELEKELEIELALERIRARTMAMQHSDELAETAYILFQQFRGLGENPDQATIGIINEAEGVIEYWVTLYGSQANRVFKFPVDEPNVTHKIYKAWKAHHKSLVIDLGGKVLHDFSKFRESMGGAGYNPGEKRRIINVAFFSKGLINVQSAVERSVESLRLLERFANVFESTYTRFLDLKKAEAQTREAQIELALERVRAKTMAMQHSNELLETSQVVFQQLRDLGETADQISIGIVKEEEGIFDLFATIYGTQMVRVVHPKIDDHFIMGRVYKNWKAHKKSFVVELGGEELRRYNVLRNQLGGQNYYNEDIGPDDSWIVSCASFSKGVLSFSSSTEPTMEAAQLLERFAIVFEQTFTRFLDLQRAEEQARESQIQLALERVRARTMAMQKSGELQEIIKVVYEQFVHLNIPVEHAGFIMDYNTRDDMHIWLADKHYAPSEITIPYFDSPHWNGFNEAKQKGSNFFAIYSGFEEKNKFYQDLFKLIPGVTDDTKEYYFSCPGLAISTVLLENVSLYIENFAGIPYTDDENGTLMRFGKVFQQTYTRFLDLKHAEEQAREAQIQLAMERVRARTMAMQKSDELAKTVSLLFKQLLGLGIRTEQIRTCGIVTFDDKKPIGEQWITETNGEIIPQSFMVPYDEAPAYKAIYKGWKDGEKFKLIHLEGKALKEHLGYLSKGTNVPVRDVVLPKQAMEIFNHVMFFSQGCLFIITKEALPEYHDVFKRFAAVFQQSYTRFLDLKKAEEQARESQIEAALEKVRSRSLAMFKTEELGEVVNTVLDKMRELGVNTESNAASIMLLEEDSRDFVQWIAIPGQLNVNSFRINYIDHPIPNEFFEARERGADFFAKSFPFEIKNTYWTRVMQESDFKSLPYQLKQVVLQGDAYALSAAMGKYSAICIPNFNGNLLSEAENNILKRFARVFEQAYIRFLDLKKAEEQAREAKIEAALEKVRARALAMHQSQDINTAVLAVFEELEKLNLDILRCGIGIIDSENQVGDIWTTVKLDGKSSVQVSGKEPMNIHPLMQGTYDAWLNQTDFLYNLEGDDLVKYYRAVSGTNFTLPESHSLTDENDGAKQYYYTPTFKSGNLYAFRESPFPDDAKLIMKRFASVLNLTFSRFLDLQRAEAQARESQIEASLERVRSKTMAMHNSQDVGDTIATMFGEFVKLGIETIRCGIAIGDSTNEMELWTAKSNPDGVTTLIIGRLDVMIHPMLQGINSAWKNKESTFEYRMNGDDLKDYYRAINNSKYYPVQYDIGSLPAKQVLTDFFFADGVVFAFTDETLADSAIQIFKRFAGVFGQTYRRYLDLRKAESQAREAQIEASLERVRSKAMAMRNSVDLLAAASTVFTELRNLGINQIRSGVGLIAKDFHNAKVYSASSSQNAVDLSLMGEVTLYGHPVFEQQYQSWLKRENYFVALEGKELAAYYKILSAGLNANLGITVKKNQKEYGHWFMFSEGFLYAWSDKEYTDAEIRILERFKNVMELTITRYIELQKSETQAREAVRQASLDRVRAEIASMRTISDLNRITPLIWNELTILGVPFIRCGVFIMDEPAQLIHTYLSTPDGKAIAAFQLQFSADTGNGVNAAVLRGWREKQVITLHWTEEEFKNFSHALVEQGEIASEEGYLTARPTTGLDLHFFPFLQGMLYAGNIEPLSGDDKDLVQSLADAFSTAYARYEDFNRLELAKQEVERTLTDLRTAQTRLIQSEKMASLGELTAGIAHEIQNPLNFVNNFSEVNQEMIDELEEELNAGNIEEALAIAADIKQNEQKINHHGKRADGIVKGMLQHSRTAGGEKLPTNINSVAEEYMRLSYHGLRAKDKGFNAEMVMHFDPDLPKVQAVGQDIGRVFLNLFNNAFYAVNQKSKKIGAGYKPEVSVTTSAEDGQVIIKVKDNGVGIPEQVKEKIMQPFFTTKPTGEGTGLGLSLTYDMVVKGHGGKLEMESIPGEYTQFTILLPSN